MTSAISPDRDRLVVLGRLAQRAGEQILVVDPMPDAPRQSFALTRSQYDCVRGVDPTVPLGKHYAADAGLFDALVSRGLARLVPMDAPLSCLDFVLVPRQRFEYRGEVDGGHRFRVADGADFVLSETGGRLLNASDGKRTVAESARDVLTAMRADDEECHIVDEVAVTLGMSPEGIMVEEALAFIRSIVASEAASFEPVA